MREPYRGCVITDGSHWIGVLSARPDIATTITPFAPAGWGGAGQDEGSGLFLETINLMHESYRGHLNLFLWIGAIGLVCFPHRQQPGPFFDILKVELLDGTGRSLGAHTPRPKPSAVLAGGCRSNDRSFVKSNMQSVHVS